jgi:hypothetical protein
MGTLTLSLSPSVDGNLIDTTSALATSSRPWTVTSTSPLVLTAGGATPSHTGGWAMSTTEDQVYVVEFEVADESGITGGAYMQVSSDPANDLGANPRFLLRGHPGLRVQRWERRASYLHRDGRHDVCRPRVAD